MIGIVAFVFPYIRDVADAIKRILRELKVRFSVSLIATIHINSLSTSKDIRWILTAHLFSLGNQNSPALLHGIVVNRDHYINYISYVKYPFARILLFISSWSYIH